jgi:hypothetical protein
MSPRTLPGQENGQAGSARFSPRKPHTTGIRSVWEIRRGKRGERRHLGLDRHCCRTSGCVRPRQRQCAAQMACGHNVDLCYTPMPSKVWSKEMEIVVILDFWVGCFGLQVFAMWLVFGQLLQRLVLGTLYVVPIGFIEALFLFGIFSKLERMLRPRHSTHSAQE